MITLGRFRLDVIPDGYFEDDADTQVQLCAARELSPRVQGRAKTRIRVDFNALLVRTADHTIVIDPGTGDKPRPDLVARYRMEWPRRFFPELAKLGVARESVDTVILTHLHWDHAGGATAQDAAGKVRPSFPRAEYFVQEKEWHAANTAADGYLSEDFRPLAEAGCLNLVRGDAEVVPGISVRYTGGHSAGHQIVVLDAGTERAIFLSDLVPTPTQLPLDCVLSYDHDVDELRTAKAAVLREAALRHDLLLFVHAPRRRAGYLSYRADGTPVLDPISL